MITMQNEERRMQNEERDEKATYSILRFGVLNSSFLILHSKVVLSRGFAPRTSAFAERRAELITP